MRGAGFSRIVDHDLRDSTSQSATLFLSNTLPPHSPRKVLFVRFGILNACDWLDTLCRPLF